MYVLHIYALHVHKIDTMHKWGYTCMLSRYVRVTERYTENGTCDKMADLANNTYNKAFVEKTPFFIFTAHVTLVPLVSLVGRVIARDGRLELTDTQVL